MIAALPLSVSAAGEYVPGNPRWSGYQNQVQWGRPAGAASGDSFEYEAQLLLGDDVVESKAVEIDTYLFFTNDVVTRPQEEYTIRVRARWIMIVGDPDGQYMVADVGEAEPPHEHSYTQKHDAAQHWQECSCGERLNVANHIYGDWRETKPATETEAGSRERDCTVCDYVQTETIPMLEHEHSYGDWQKDETQHWKECRCGEKTEVGNHTFDDWTITKEPTTTETGSRERTCSICKYTQEETIPVHEHSIHDEAWKYDDTEHWQECSCGERLNVANHIYGDWKVTKEATETEEGSRERGCAVCEYVQTEAIPAAGTGSPQTGDSSDMALWISLMLASCGGVLGTFNGQEYTSFKDVDDIDPLGHKAEKVDGDAPTATEPGNIEYWYCPQCDTYFKDADLTEVITKEQTVLAPTGEAEPSKPEETPSALTDPPQDKPDKTDDTTESPQTGDSSNLALWIGLMLASCGVLGMLFYRRKKAAAGK